MAIQFAALAGMSAKQAIGAIGVDVAKMLLSGEARAAAQAMSNAGSREYYYQANVVAPNIVPDVNQCIDLLHRKKITREQLSWLLAYNGVRWQANGAASTNTRKAWQHIVALSRPDLSLSEYYSSLLQSRATLNGMNLQIFRDRALREGIDVDRLQIIEKKTQPYSLETVLTLYYQGFLVYAEADEWLEALGYTTLKQRQNLLSMSEHFTPEQVLVLRNRGIITNDVSAKLWLSRTGMQQPISDMFLNLRHQIPGYSDLVSFALREVWDQATVNKWGYDNEFPAPFQYWMDKQGMNWSEDVTLPGGGAIPGVPWPLAYWRAHWNTMSPTMAYVAYHRLRPNRIADYQAQFPGLQSFELADLQSILKIADYPDKVRNILAACNFVLPTRVDLRRMYSMGIFGQGLAAEVELAERYEDLGYRDSDARLIAKFVVRNETAAKLRPLKTGIRQQILKGYKIGFYAAESAAADLHKTTLTDPDELAAFNALPVGQKEIVGMANPAVVAKLKSIDYDLQADLIKTNIASIKAQYHRFDISQVEAMGELSSLGIAGPRAQMYMDGWNQEHVIKGHKATGAELCSWFKAGLLTGQEFDLRLSLLGYHPADRARVITMCQAAKAKDDAKTQLALAKSSVAAIKAIKALLKEVRSEQNYYQKEIAKYGTASQVAKWACIGIISQPVAMSQLAKMGWPVPNALALLAAQGAKCSPNGDVTALLSHYQGLLKEAGNGQEISGSNHTVPGTNGDAD